MAPAGIPGSLDGPRDSRESIGRDAGARRDPTRHGGAAGYPGSWWVGEMRSEMGFTTCGEIKYQEGKNFAWDVGIWFTP